jgi:DNA topoisomerase IA
LIPDAPAPTLFLRPGATGGMDITDFASLKGKRLLVVAEKPSVAKKIFGVLKSALEVDKAIKTKGKSRYNPVYRITVKTHQIVITSVSGFLYELEFEPPFASRYKWRLRGNLDGEQWTLRDMIDAETRWKLGGRGKYKKTNRQIEQQIKELARNSDFFVSAADNDFAGELIGYQALNAAALANPSIRPLRMVFSSLTYADLVGAWQDLGGMRAAHKDAEEARQVTDLMTGALFTRLLTLLVQDRVPGVVISWGGCQTLFLKHICDAFREHENFEPRQFWEVKAEVRWRGKEYSAAWSDGRTFERSEAKLCLIDTRGERSSLVTGVAREEWKKHPPVPLRTASLLQNLTKMAGMTAKQVMSVAEDLYNKGFISYPRTENEVHPYTFNANRTLEEFEDHPAYGRYTTALLEGKERKRIYPRRGRHQTKEHDPIYPTRSATQSQVEGAVPSRSRVKAWRVYDFVARHFIATCSDPAVFDKTEVEMDIGGRPFEMSGKVQRDRGFMEIYPFYRPRINEMPGCEEGDELQVASVELVDGWTQPPPLPAESDIIKWASDNKIGTDATFHSHIDKVLSRDYAKRDRGKKLVPTELGMALCSSLEDKAPLMVDAGLRHSLQEKMDLIAEGEIGPSEVVGDFRDFSRQAYSQICEGRAEVADSLASTILQRHSSGQDLGVCGKCGASMHLETRHKYGNKVSRFAVCEGCDTELVLPKAGSINPVTGGRCLKCGFTPIKVKDYLICPYCFTQERENGLFYCRKCGETRCEYSGAGLLKLGPETQTASLGDCPKCGSPLAAAIESRKRFVKCGGEGCNFSIRLPRASKGQVKVSPNSCPKCGLKVFDYKKRYPKGKLGKTTHFCVGCDPGKYVWCFSCPEECKGGE